MKIPFLHKHKTGIILNECLRQIEDIRKVSDIIAICPRPTGYSWMGVQVATLSLFPNCTFQIPQDYSNQTLTDAQLVEIANTINDLDYKQVIFSGYLPYFSRIMCALKSTIVVKIVYHGFLSELSGNDKQIAAFTAILEQIKIGRIKCVGCVKKGLALSLSKLFGSQVHEIILPNNKIAGDIVPMSDEINIGCMVNTSFRKNIPNQATAALMVDKSILHVFETQELAYLPQNRIEYHSLLSHDEFVELLSKMTINLHVTFSESWGQVLSESVSMGVPCLSAYTSSFFDYDDDLKQKLIVNGFDDSWHIYKKIDEVLKDRDAIAIQCIAYAKKMNILADEKLNEFLGY